MQLQHKIPQGEGGREEAVEREGKSREKKGRGDKGDKGKRQRVCA